MKLPHLVWAFYFTTLFLVTAIFVFELGILPSLRVPKRPLFLKEKAEVKQEVENQTGNLTLEQKIGHLVFLTLAGKTLSQSEQALLQEDKVGGILLLEKNIDNPAQLEALIGNLKKFEVLVAVDQEGGRVSRLPWLDTTPQDQIETEVEAASVAYKRGKQMRELGINLNLAPVVEQSQNEASFLAKEKRGFKNNPSNLASAMVSSYLKAGVIPAVKHFPGGLGRTSFDPHFQLPILDIEEKELEEDLVPFKEVISANAPMIMVTHILYPKFDENPASSSPFFLKDILRQRLNFSGVILVDDLSMAAVKGNYDVGEYALNSLLAGADLLLVSDQQDYQKVMLSLKTAVATQKLPAARVEESWVRFMSLFKRFQN